MICGLCVMGDENSFKREFIALLQVLGDADKKKCVSFLRRF